MSQYLTGLKNRQTKLAHLAELRNLYRDGKTSVSDEILSLEKNLENELPEMKRIKNQIIKLESASN